MTDSYIWAVQIGNVVYLSGYFKVSSAISSGQHLLTFTGLTRFFETQYIFIHDTNNAVAARLETSYSGTRPTLKVATAISGSDYKYISATLMLGG